MIALNPYAIGGAVAVLLASSTGSYFLGRTHMANARDAKAFEQIQKIEKARDAGVERVRLSAAAVADAQTHQTTDFREITRETVKIVDRPVYRSVCADVDGVGLLDRAHAAANRGFAGAPAFTPTGASEDAAQR